MIFEHKQVAAAIALSLGAGGVSTLVAPAQAQDLRIDVTGSNIRRVGGDGALPVQIITREDIEREGIQTAFGVVERLSANSSIGGLNLQGSEGATLAGYASASLRGLGASRTLVLLNGRRLSNTAFSGTSVDINSIPLSAIERVEVLTDGASAIYGTDAEAGVINFILRKDFRGVEAYAYYGDSENGGGKVQRYNVTGGWGDLAKDKFNVFATLDYNKIDPIAANEREFSKTAFLQFAGGGGGTSFVFDRSSGNSIPGNVFIPDVGTRNPANPGCMPPFSFPTVNSPLQCRFDYASVIDIVPPSESWNVYGSARWAFAPQHEAFVEAAWSRTESTAKVSPSPISSATILSGQDVLTAPSSPFYPLALATQFGVQGQTLPVFWRSLELGPRTDINTIEQTRIVAGVQGVVANWDYSLDVNWSESKATDEWIAGWTRGSILLPILNSGLINLFGLNTPDALALLRPALVLGKVIDNTGTMTEFNAKASKDVFKLPAGSIGVALGVAYRRETFEQNAVEALSSADVPGLGGSVSSLPEVKRNIWAVFGEVNVPIVKNLEANFAVRYDDYENVKDGKTWNPKVSVRWQHLQQLLLRASYGTGFRAPGLPELFLPSYFGATGDIYSDPLRCPATGSPRDCDAQFTTRLGGTSTLKPEESTNGTAGIIFEPTSRVSVGAEYWWIKIKNIIGIPPEFLLFSNMVTAEVAGQVVRYAPGSAGCQNAGSPPLPCPVNFGIQNFINLPKVQTSGVDFTLNFRPAATGVGRFGFAFQGTYVIEWKQQDLPGGSTNDLVGTYAGGRSATVFGSGSSGSFPRWKHNANLSWSRGPWNANLNNTFVDGYSELVVNPLTGAFGDPPIRKVGAYSVFGLNGSYAGFRNWVLSLGIKNLFDKDPPFTRQSQAFQVGYDPAIADPTGRFYWGSVKYAFQ